MQRRNKYELFTDVVKPGLTGQILPNIGVSDELYDRACEEGRDIKEYPEAWEVVLSGLDDYNNAVRIALSYTQIKKFYELLKAAAEEERRIRELDRAQFAQGG